MSASVQWEDATSYSRGRPRVQTTWRATFGPRVAITVTNGHIYCPGQFVVHCKAIGLDTYPLPEGITPEHAQELALAKVRQMLREMAAEVGA